MYACVSIPMSDIGIMIEFIPLYRFHIKQLLYTMVCAKGLTRRNIVTV